MNRSTEKVKSDYFGPNTNPFSPLLSNALHQVQFQKNLMNRFKENFKNVNSGLKNSQFTPF